VTGTADLPTTESPDLPIEVPNLYLLQGDGRTISLTTSGFDGKPHLSYHDAHRTLSFSGDDITFEETALGTLATVILQRTPDIGDTSFTAVIPRVNLIGAPNAIIHTLGITAMHRTTFLGLGRGQLTSYHVSHLSGSASRVQF
jgi:hypothetical protein